MLGKASNIIENGKTLTEKVKQTLANMDNDMKLKYCVMQYCVTILLMFTGAGK